MEKILLDRLTKLKQKYFLIKLATHLFKMAFFGASVAKTSIVRILIMNFLFGRETSLMD